MIVAGFFFAAMGVFVKFGAEQFDAAEMAFYRSFVGLFFITGLVLALVAGLTIVVLRVVLAPGPGCTTAAGDGAGPVGGRS